MDIAILGFGTVGAGAYETIRDSHCGLNVKRILDIRVPLGFEHIVTSDYNEILDDPDIELVAEAIGGLHPAYEFVSAALKAGKHVVSANKHLICHYFRELHALAAEHHCMLRFTPSAGGGIPWLYNLQRQKRCDEILWLRGIMNGTTNYILDAMQHLGSQFDEVLNTAKALGYAEADPSADIDGLDVRRKCAISASIAYDTALSEEDVPTFGIRNITRRDIAYFDSLGMTCKLLGCARRDGNRVIAYVEPTLLPAGAIESSVGTNYNCITLFGRKVGRLSFLGQGAGKYPTGCAMVQDMLDIAAGIRFPAPTITQVVPDPSIYPHRYYIRTSAHVPDDIAERRDGNVVMTVPLSVTDIHRFASQAQNTDPRIFLAGLEDNIE